MFPAILLFAFSLAFAYIGYLFTKLGALGSGYWPFSVVGYLMLALVMVGALALVLWLMMAALNRLLGRTDTVVLDAARPLPWVRPQPLVSLGAPLWQPSREVQIEALMNGDDKALLYRAFHGADCVLPDYPLQSDFAHVVPDADKLAVFTIDFDALVDHVMATRWYEKRLFTERIGGDGSFYLLREHKLYKLMFTERHYTGELYASAELRPVVARYLASDRYGVVPLPGLAGLAINPYD